MTDPARETTTQAARELRHGMLIVDECDADFLERKWYSHAARNVPYAMCSYSHGTKGKERYLHRMIMERVLGRPMMPGECTDHINGDGLDNRRCNLRVCTNQQNTWNKPKPGARNKSGVHGVNWNSKTNKWTAEIQIKRKSIYLGEYLDISDAAQARKAAEIEHYGEFSSGQH